MITVTLADAKARLSALVEQAANGETVCITRRGKPIAQITMIERPRKPIDIEALRRLTDAMKGPPTVSGEWLRQQRDKERY